MDTAFGAVFTMGTAFAVSFTSDTATQRFRGPFSFVLLYDGGKDLGVGHGGAGTQSLLQSSQDELEKAVINPINPITFGPDTISGSMVGQLPPFPSNP